MAGHRGYIRPRNDLLCVEWDVKPYTLRHRGYTVCASVKNFFCFALLYPFHACNFAKWMVIPQSHTAVLLTRESFLHPQMRLLMRSVASVCLSYSGSNFWKHWPKNFIYNMQIGYILRISWSHSCVKVTASRSRSQKQKVTTLAGGVPSVERQSLYHWWLR